MGDFDLDAQEWRFLNNPSQYIESRARGLLVEPLKRQFETVKEILMRLASGRGVLLADDVGLGKTTVGALVAWVVARQNKRVRIYAPNDVLRRRWAEELERHATDRYESMRIKGDVKKLHLGCIQVATHYALVKSYANNEQRTECDLMIIDEAHRAKGDKSSFNEALRNLGGRAKRKLILTATPFSIRLTELEQLLQFVGATKLESVRLYAGELDRLYKIGGDHDVTAEAVRLVSAAKAAISELQPYLIRHGIDDLSLQEQEHFGAVSPGSWEIPTPPATSEDISLLLRMDRLLQLTMKQKGERRNDPRFHIGWLHVKTKLREAAERTNEETDLAALHHIKVATEALGVRLIVPHPKIAAISEAIRPLVGAGEKVLVFCHHRAPACELLGALERSLMIESVEWTSTPDEEVWRAAWKVLLPDERPLIAPIIDWLCTPGLRRQVSGWLGEPASTKEALAEQLRQIRPRNATSRVPTISEAAEALKETLLKTQSTSTCALLKNIVADQGALGGKKSRFPGALDDGLRTMGAWDADGSAEQPKTLYTGKPDIVLAIFNSPFGPDVLVTTDRLSEGVDLHRYCRHLIHYELDPSPVRTLQRNGRVRRVGSWASLTGQPICYAYPMFGGTRDEKAVRIMRQRINAFGLLLGGAPSLDDESVDNDQSYAEEVLLAARKDLESLNRGLSVSRPEPDGI